MAIKIKKETNRLKGFNVASGVTLVAGMVVTKDATDSTGETIKLSDGTTANYPLGLSLETNVVFSDGAKYYDDYAKGGKVGSTWGPAIVELYDDGRGSPYVTTDTYNINDPVYCDGNGRITSTPGGKIQIGWVDKTPENDGILGVRIII